MLLLLLMLFTAVKISIMINNFIYKRKINSILKTISSKEDLLYLRFKDLLYIIIEVLNRHGYKVELTAACGVDGCGLRLNDIQFTEVWKYGLNHVLDVEIAMNLSKCMQNNSIYRGMLITLGDFKQCTKNYCYKNVIECINGDQLLCMCKAVQDSKRAALETAK